MFRLTSVFSVPLRPDVGDFRQVSLSVFSSFSNLRVVFPGDAAEVYPDAGSYVSARIKVELRRPGSDEGSLYR